MTLVDAATITRFADEYATVNFTMTSTICQQSINVCNIHSVLVRTLSKCRLHAKGSGQQAASVASTGAARLAGAASATARIARTPAAACGAADVLGALFDTEELDFDAEFCEIQASSAHRIRDSGE